MDIINPHHHYFLTIGYTNLVTYMSNKFKVNLAIVEKGFKLFLFFNYQDLLPLVEVDGFQNLTDGVTKHLA